LERLEDPIPGKAKLARQSEKRRVESRREKMCVYIPKLEIDIDSRQPED